MAGWGPLVAEFARIREDPPEFLRIRLRISPFLPPSLERLTALRCLVRLSLLLFEKLGRLGQGREGLSGLVARLPLSQGVAEDGDGGRFLIDLEDGFVRTCLV